MKFSDIAQFALRTVQDPAGALRQLQALNLAAGTRWMVLLLSVGGSAILSWLTEQLLPIQGESVMASLVGQPLVLALLELVGIVIAIALLASVGRMFGGRGSFDDALLVFGWIEVIMLMIQICVVVLVVLFPIVAVVVSLLSYALFFYLLVMMTRELHGFRSPFLVAAGIVATALISGFVLTAIMAALGLMPVTGVPDV